MKKVFSIIFYLISMTIFSQKGVIEETLMSNGKVISKTKYDKSSKVLSAGNENFIIDKFYRNQNNIRILDSLISFRFYQKTPYFKFKEIIESKNRSFGNFLNKSLISIINSESGITVCMYNVEYEKKSTIEKIGLIQENKEDSYHIINYDISDK